MVKERVWYNITDDTAKKDLSAAFKNETKFTKKIPFLDRNNEEIGKIVKMDVYNTYVDFWLDDYIDDSLMVNRNGMITHIEIYDKENSKGVKQKRIKYIKG